MTRIEAMLEYMKLVTEFVETIKKDDLNNRFHASRAMVDFYPTLAAAGVSHEERLALTVIVREDTIGDNLLERVLSPQSAPHLNDRLNRIIPALREEIASANR